PRGSLAAFSRQGRNRPVARRRLKRFFDLVYPSDHSTLTTLVLSPHQAAEGIDMVNLLDVEVWGSGIIVTLPGTNYWVRYFKETDSPGLFAADIADNSNAPS